MRCGAMLLLLMCSAVRRDDAATDVVFYVRTAPPEDNSLHQLTYVVTEAIHKYYTRITGVI